MKGKKYPKFLLLLGNKSVDVFNYFNVEELHGLYKSQAEKYPETRDDAYIAGFCNYIPKPNNKYQYGDEVFIFINVSRLKNNMKDATLIMHETMHLSLMLHNWNIKDKEEQIITDAEKYANEILNYIFNFNV